MLANADLDPALAGYGVALLARHGAELGKGGQHPVLLLEVTHHQQGQREVCEELGRPHVLD